MLGSVQTLTFNISVEKNIALVSRPDHLAILPHQQVRDLYQLHRSNPLHCQDGREQEHHLGHNGQEDHHAGVS